MDTKKTPLYDFHIDNGGRMMAFAGWEMPIQFKGLVNEHFSVRQSAGIFDISHMGMFRLNGRNPKDALQALVPTDPNQIGKGETPALAAGQEDSCYRAGGEGIKRT